MKKAKFICCLLSSMLAFSLMLPTTTFAASGSTSSFTQDGIYFEVGISANAPILTRAQQLYNDVVNGSSNYTAAFTCHPRNGNNMEFSVTNTGDTVITVICYMDGEQLGDPYSIAPGQTKYTRATFTSGLSNSFEFTLSSRGGMYCTVYAEQY